MICCSYRRHQLSDFFGDIFRPETNRLNLPRWAESVFNEKRSRKRSVHERASRDRRRSREGELGGGRGGAARGSGGAVCFEFTFCRERWRQAAGRDASCSLIGGEGKIGKVIGEQREQRAPQEGGFARFGGLRLRERLRVRERERVRVRVRVRSSPPAASRRQWWRLSTPAQRPWMRVRLCVGVCAVGWRWTVATDFVGSDRRAFHCPGAAHHDQSASAREVRRERPSGQAWTPRWPTSRGRNRRRKKGGRV